MATAKPQSDFDDIREDLTRLRADLASLAETVKTAAGQKAEGITAAAAEHVGKAAKEARQKGEESVAALEEQIRNRPFASILIALFVGIIAGKLLDR